MRSCGRQGSEYGGMSNDKTGEKPVRLKSKVSYPTLFEIGLVGPKARQKCVVDGQQVNIPAPLCFCDGVTFGIEQVAGWKWPSKFRESAAGKSTAHISLGMIDCGYLRIEAGLLETESRKTSKL